jgi:hypothetical protein
VWLEEASGHLYLRDMAREETVQLDTGLVGKPEFQTASNDGSKVFFTEGGDLYEYDVEHGKPVALTKGANVLGMMIGASEDGSYVYFVANGLLAPGAVPGGCGLPGLLPSRVACNLYMGRYNGTEWEAPKLLAVLSGEDAASWGEAGGAMAATSGAWLRGFPPAAVGWRSCRSAG